MLSSLIGTKGKMSQVYTQKGVLTPVTRIAIEPNAIVQIKTSDVDGYTAVQLGYGESKRVTKPIKGHIAKSGVAVTPRYIREVSLKDVEGIAVGSTISASDVFTPGDVVCVDGVSKGKGFAGVVKRWGFAGGPKTHGQTDRHRAPGSIGAGTTPSRVLKGKKMAGRMGGVTTHVKKLVIMAVESDSILVQGSVPGSTSTLVTVRKTGTAKNFDPIPAPKEAETETVPDETSE